MIVPSYKILIVSDNKAEGPLESEHGFSLWIEAGNRKILFDTGQGAAFRNNADLLGIDLGKTEDLILSHGHYDHTGSVDWVLGQAPNAEVYLNPSAFLPRYSFRDGYARSVQMPGSAMSSIISRPDGNVHWISSPSHLTGGIGLTGPVPRINSFEDTGGKFYLDTKAQKEDPIRDDMSIWIATEEGLVICAGCCHSGIVNTIRYIIEITGEHRIKLVVGGLHLINAGMDRLEKTAAALNEFNIGALVPCHCTGDAAAAFLAENLNCPVTPGYAGMVIRQG